MKKIIISFFLALFVNSIYSQSPNSFTYQSVVRDASGKLMSNKDISLRISILKSSQNGSSVYSEEHSVTTNTNGLATLIIGKGLSADEMDTIDWSDGPYYLKVEVDPEGGFNYIAEDTSQLLSVPYAMMSKESEESNKNLELIINEVDRSIIVEKNLQDQIDLKQDKLVAGDGITISNSIISTIPGKVISSTMDNGDGTITFIYNDGTTFTTGDLTGPAGAKGDKGDTGDTGAQGEQGPAGADGTVITGSATTIDTETLTASRAMVTDGNGKVAVSDVTATELSVLDGVTATTAELNYVDGVTSNIQNQLDAKQATITGSATTIDTETLTASRAMVTDGNGKVAVSDVTATEIGYLDGVTSNIQTQLDNAGGGASNINGLTDALVTNNSFYIGNDPSSTTGTAQFNVVVGITALNALTEGDYNTAIGHDALTDITGGSNNTAVGANALENSDNGGYNTAVGVRALRFSGNNYYNTAVGYGAGSGINSGDKNVLIGYNAKTTSSSGDNQIVIGSGANGQGTNTAVIGNSDLTTVYMGTDSGATVRAGGLNLGGTDVSSTAAELNILDGVTATTAELNILDGVTATATELNILDGVTATTAELNYVDGVTSNIQTQINNISGGGASNINGLSDALVEDNSLYIGNDPSSTTSTAEYNVAVGINALDAITTGDINTAVGYDALTDNTTGADNTAVGANTLANNTTGNFNTAFGRRALESNTTGRNNVGIGDYALQGVSGSYNVGIGSNAMRSNVSGDYNTAAGYMALMGNSSMGDHNTGFGFEVLRDNEGEENTAVGSQSLMWNTSGTGNVSMGYWSLRRNTTGDSNTALGTWAGDIMTTGSNNVIIGYEADPSANNASNQIVIGKGATGQADNSVVLGNADVTAVYMAQDSGATVYAGGLNLGGTAVSSNAGELNLLDGVTATTAELNILDGVTSTTAELNILDGVTATTAELNILDGVTATTAELNILDGVTATTAELNYVDGVTSNIQTQINNISGGGASSIDDLSDAKSGGTNFPSSLLIGHVPTQTLVNAEYNTIVGIEAMEDIITAKQTVAIGYRAGRNLINGGENTIVGNEAMGLNTYGGLRNSAFGAYALYKTGINGSTGQNVGIGYKAGYAITTGTRNVMIGALTDPDDANAENQIAIGYQATGAGNNTVVLGNDAVTAVYMSEDSGATVYAGGLNLGGTAVSSTAAELNLLDGVTSTTAELNILDGVTATATELNLLDGVTATTTEINYLDGVTSNIQTQLNSAGGASNVTGLSDALVEDNSVYIGNDPSSTTNSAQYNVAVGTTALDAITTGDKIVAIGYNALGKNTTGSSNTALGMYALNNNTTGNLNTAVGNEALKSNTTGENNTAMGWEALSSNTTGSRNTGSGLYVLRYNSTGQYNTAMGYEAGDVITTGSNNTIIGYQADPSANNASNQIVIGKGATGQGDNYAVIGNADVTRVYAAQDGAAVLYANATINSSDMRLKDFIKPVNLGLQFINKLNPVSYLKISKSQYKGEEENNETRYEYGLIAQEVDKILKESDPENTIVSEDNEGFLGMDYKQIIMPLIKSVQELTVEIEKLKKELELLKQSKE